MTTSGPGVSKWLSGSGCSYVFIAFRGPKTVHAGIRVMAAVWASEMAEVDVQPKVVNESLGHFVSP